MRDPSAAALKFTLVASAVVLALIANFLIRDGGLRWAATPLVIAVGCLALASLRRSVGPGGSDELRDDGSCPDREGRFSSHPFSFLARRPVDGGDSPPGEDARTGRRWAVEFNESFFGVAATVASIVVMCISLREFGQRDTESTALAWYGFGASVALALAAIPTFDGRWTRLIARLKADDGLRIGFRAVAPWLALAAILALGAGIRLYNLDHLPAGMWYDEADNLIHARDYGRDPGSLPVYTPSTNNPTMFLIPVAAVSRLAGASITTGRLVAAGFGLLGIVATFLLARQVMGDRRGLIAAFLVAVMRWDIVWSRVGMIGITAVVCAALTGWLTLRAARSGRLSDYAFAGASLGLGMWFYTSFRMFPLVVGFVLVHHLLTSRPPFRVFASRVVLMALVSLFVAAPVVQYAMDNPAEFFSRTETTSVFSLTPRDQWADHIRSGLVRHLLMFNQAGDANPRHNLPGAPMLDAVTGSLFLLGFFFALTRWREAGMFALPFWALFMVLPGVLTVPWEAPQSLRAITVIPAVAALSAFVIGELWTAARRVPWPVVRRSATPAVVAALAFIAYSNVGLYFGEQANDPAVYAAFSTEETLMSRSQVEQQSRGYSLWVSRQFLFSPNIALLANRPHYEVIKAPETLPLDSTQVWNGAAVYFEPRERGFWEVMRAYYPDAQYRAVTAPNGSEPLYYEAFVGREELAERQGLDVTYTVRDAEVEGRLDTVQESVWYADAGPGEYPHEVRLEGALHIPVYGEYELVLDSARGRADVMVELDGKAVLGAGKTGVRVRPGVGLHTLSIRATIDGPDDLVRVLWRPPDGDLGPIPLSRLYRGTVRPLGLAGRFYAGSRTDGVPDSVQITPTMDVFHYDPVVPEPYFAAWDGVLHIDQPGPHKFDAVRTGSGRVALYIDGQPAARDPGGGDDPAERTVHLDVGEHTIRVEYTAESAPSQFRILWSPLGGAMRPIPVEIMTPAREHMLQRHN